MGMTKKLLIVFASGLVLALILLSSAWVLGGDELSKRIGEGKGLSITVDGHHHRGPETRRSLTFNPDVPLTISTPVKLRFTKGDTVSMEVSGPQELVDRLQWEGGKLSQGKGMHFGGDGVVVTITAPRLAGLTLETAAEAELHGLDQPALRVVTRGAAELEASGKVVDLDVESAVAGDLDFSDLPSDNARVVTRGAGEVKIAASGKVDVEINGVGNVSLRRKPAQLTSRIHGLGSVDNDY